MSSVHPSQWETLQENTASLPQNFEEVANELCDKALDDAKAQLHPLLRNIELDRLDRRHDFAQAFKLAFEQRIAQKLAAWQPGVQAVFAFDESWIESRKPWDGSIHLLVKVPHLSKGMKALGKQLDKSLVKYLKQLNWSRFRKHESILEIEQVTADEFRRCLSYGAMFCAVYSVPVKVWPQNGCREEGFHNEEFERVCMAKRP